MTGDITNDGDITADASARTTATGKAYWIRQDLTGDFTNTGTINTDVSTDVGLATADGVFIEGNMVGNISNSGGIATLATGPTAKDTENVT